MRSQASAHQLVLIKPQLDTRKHFGLSIDRPYNAHHSRHIPFLLSHTRRPLQYNATVFGIIPID